MYSRFSEETEEDQQLIEHDVLQKFSCKKDCAQLQLIDSGLRLIQLMKGDGIVDEGIWDSI